MHKPVKKVLFTLTFALLIAMMSTSAVFADLPGTGWWSAMFIQNIADGSVDGTLNMTAYPAAAADASTYGSDFIPVRLWTGLDL